MCLSLAGTRLKYELTQKQLAKLSGISHATISAYEHNKRPLSKLAAIRLANAMGEDPTTFLEYAAEKRRNTPTTTICSRRWLYSQEELFSIYQCSETNSSASNCTCQHW